MMFASFHSKETTFSNKLNTLASGILICSTVSISSFGNSIHSRIIFDMQILYIFISFRKVCQEISQFQLHIVDCVSIENVYRNFFLNNVTYTHVHSCNDVSYVAQPTRRLITLRTVHFEF